MDASFVSGVAERIKVHGLKPEAASLLAPRVEMHVKRMLQVRRNTTLW